MKKKFPIILMAVVLIGASFTGGFFLTGKKGVAQTSQETPFWDFGGHMIYADYCECSGSFELFYEPASPVAYFPFGWLGYSEYLEFPPYIPTVVAYFDPLIPQTDQIGKFVPGFQSCWIAHKSWCIPLDTLGTIARVAPAAIPYVKPIPFP